MLLCNSQKLTRGDTDLKVHINNSLIDKVDKFKYLGVWLDPALTWNEQIDKISKTVSKRYGLLGGGGTQLFFGGCVPHGFPKVGSRERIFLEKWGVLGTKIRKICVLRAEILTKTRLKMEIFSKIWKGGTPERRNDGKLVG